MSGSLLDPQLLDALECSESRALQLDVWRVAWRSQEVLKGGPGGRWNPRPLTALYTSLSVDGAVAEVYALLSKAPVFSSADKLLYQLQVKTQNTLILDDLGKLDGIGVDLRQSPEDSIAQCQLIGEASYRLDYDSLLVPSIRWDCANLVLFSDLLDPDDIQAKGDANEINWPAWADRYAEVSRNHTRNFIRRRGQNA